MAKIQCKMCGGNLDLPDDVTIGTCPYCNTMTTFPKITSDHVEQLYSRAEHYRHAGDFDKAMSAYEAIVRETPDDAEAYWGLVLSRFGIEYVEDPVSHERIPTCHRVQYESILSDSDYQLALENAPDEDAREVYESEAIRIGKIQKDILAISSKEKPFDVFICYKETTDGGSRTKDSTDAQEIFYQLTNAGYKVFFSRITLEDKLGQQYEPYIFAALNSAKVMLVIGSKKEYFNAVWVKNEWSRFLSLMKKNHSKLLIPCYKDMDVYDLPEELSMLQSQDMSKIGFIQDLLRGIQKILSNEKNNANETQNETKIKTVVSSVSSIAEPLLKRARLYRDNQNYDKSRQYLQKAIQACDKILDKDPENGEAYLYKLLGENDCISKEELLEKINLIKNIEQQDTFVFLMKFADEGLKKKLEAKLEEQKKKDIYNLLIQDFENCGYNLSKLTTLVQSLKEFSGYLDADKIRQKCEERIESVYKSARQNFQAKYQEAMRKMEINASPEEWEDLEKAFNRMVGLVPEAKEVANQCKKNIRIAHYTLAMEMLNNAHSIEDIEKARNKFTELALVDNDAQSMIEQCNERIKQIENHNKQCEYNSAKELLEKNEYEEALKIFENLKDYTDVIREIELCKKKIKQKKIIIQAVCSTFIVLILVAIFYYGEKQEKRFAEEQKRKQIELQAQQKKEQEIQARQKQEIQARQKHEEEIIAQREREQQELANKNIQAQLMQGRVILSKNKVLILKKIRAGIFIMGNSIHSLAYQEGDGLHKVRLTDDFWIGKYEVTQSEYEAIMGNNPSKNRDYSDLPVENVSWNDAKEFCKKLNTLYKEVLPQGYQFDLPTEAQWEYACRAGKKMGLLNNGKPLTTRLGECANLDEVGWYDKNSSHFNKIETHWVGMKSPNAWGLYDMHGNVSEWCRDWGTYIDYSENIVDNPVGPSSGRMRVCRGGDCYNIALYCDAGYRVSHYPNERRNNVGFRLALVPIQ